MEMWRRNIQLNSFQLKMIAIITMLVDHIGCVLFPQYVILREIGRVSFPIFCFLLVEGFFHTKNIGRYVFRCFLLGIISEIPYDLAMGGRLWGWDGQNVGFTLCLGLIALWLIEERSHQVNVLKNHGLWWKYGSILTVGLIIGGADLLRMDYGAAGILMILIFYMFRQHFLWQLGVMSVLNVLLMKGIQGYGVFAMLPIGLYNGKRGCDLKYVFYVFYPLHLFVLWCIKIYI